MIANLKTKSLEAIKSAGLEALLCVGVDNLTYLTGCTLPFAENYPGRTAALLVTGDGEYRLFIPWEWEQSIRDQGWNEPIVSYSEYEASTLGGQAQKIVEEVSQLGLTTHKIGLDLERTTHKLYEILTSSLPKVQWTSFDSHLRDLRLRKSSEEIALLETAAIQADRSIIGALNHAEGAINSLGYAVAEFSERIRVHLVEFGGMGAGHLSVLQGDDLKTFFVPPRGMFKEGNLVRMDTTTLYKSYWSNIGRMAVVGESSQAQRDAYHQNQILMSTALEHLKPGVQSNTVFEQVQKRAGQEGIKFWSDAGVGHGVGVSEREAPFLNATDNTKLAPGMVIVLDIFTAGPNEEWIHSKETYEITQDGSRHMSWYHNWDRLYAIIGYRALH